MFTEERDRWDVLVGVIVLVMLVGGLYIVNHHRVKVATPKPAASAPAAALPKDAAGAADKPEARSPNASVAAVYECSRDGQRILSDQPCGADASVREIAQPNRMDAQDTRNLYRPVEAVARRGGVYSGDLPAATSSVCDSIEAQINAINARMRHAYTSWQGEQFRERLRVLSRERYEAKCIR